MQRLFSALRHEFKHLVFFYFTTASTTSSGRTMPGAMMIGSIPLRLLPAGSDYRGDGGGDAKMGPYEITWPGGSVSTGTRSRPGVARAPATTFPKMVWVQSAAKAGVAVAPLHQVDERN